MSALSEFSLNELMTEISLRAGEANIAQGLGNIGLFTLLRGVSGQDLDKLEFCDGVIIGDDEAFILPEQFEDSNGEISDELLNHIEAAKTFGIELIQAYH